jgi:hypothetical protein
MPSGYGFGGHIGYAKEASGGTPVAAANYVEGISEDISANISRYEPVNIHGKFSEPDDIAGLRQVGGNISFPAMAEDIGFFLAKTMGQQSNSVVLSGSLHKHEFLMATADWDTKFALPPVTLEIFRDVTSSQQYAGCNINQLQIGVAPNQELRFTAGIVGKSFLNLAKTTPTYETTPTTPFTFDTCSVQIGGVAVDNVEGLNLTINNQLSGVPTLNNSNQISRIRRNGMQLIRLGGQLSFEDIVDYNDFINQTERAFKFSMFIANSYSLVVELPRFVYSAFPLTMPGRDRQVVSFEGMGRVLATSASAIKIDLTNVTSGY